MKQNSLSARGCMPEDEIITDIIRHALAEDVGCGDITTNALIAENTNGEALFVAREPMVFCGFAVVEKVFSQLDAGCRLSALVSEGEKVAAGRKLITIAGKARAILSGERVALNLLQRMCGVATLTAQYVDAARGTGAVILDTRKTMPGLRVLDKYAVRCGGGENHRMGLYDAVLIKDNHIALCGGVKEAVKKIKEALSNRATASTSAVIYPPQKKENNIFTEIECDTLQQVEEALKAGVERILLDNMSTEQLRRAVRLVNGEAKLEASGNVTLDTVKEIAATGVDFISVGRITHSAPAADIGLDVEICVR